MANEHNSDITLAHCWGFGDNWKWWPILAPLSSDWLLGWVGFSTILRRMAFPWRFFADILVDLTQVCTQRWHLLSQSSWEKSPLLIRGPLLPSTGSNEQNMATLLHWIACTEMRCNTAKYHKPIAFLPHCFCVADLAMHCSCSWPYEEGWHTCFF